MNKLTFNSESMWVHPSTNKFYEIRRALAESGKELLICRYGKAEWKDIGRGMLIVFDRNADYMLGDILAMRKKRGYFQQSSYKVLLPLAEHYGNCTGWSELRRKIEELNDSKSLFAAPTASKPTPAVQVQTATSTGLQWGSW